MKIEIDGDFHDYCDGCQYIDLIIQARAISGKPIYACNNYHKCQQLWSRLATTRKDGGINNYGK